MTDSSRDIDHDGSVPLPAGWTWERVAAERAKWGIDDAMVPVATAPGVVAWGTINSVRQSLKEAR